MNSVYQPVRSLKAHLYSTPKTAMDDGFHFFLCFRFFRHSAHRRRVYDDGPNGAVPLKTTGGSRESDVAEKPTKTLHTRLKMAEVSKSVSEKQCEIISIYLMLPIKGTMTNKSIKIK